MSDVHDENQTPIEPDSKEDGFVAKSAYQKVSQDMHKYKSEMKTLAAQLEAVKADQEAKEKSTLEENEKWHDLYKKSEAKLAQIASERDSERNKFVDFHKRNAVIQQLGGFKKNDYTKFINTNSIEVVDDGSVDENSVMAEVERIRKEYPELIKTTPKTELPNSAPKAAIQKAVKDMSQEELAQARRALLTKK